MPRPPSFWLAQPSRFAAFKPARARLALVGLALLIAVSLLALLVPDPPALSAVTAVDQPMTDLALYEKIVAAVRGGEGYYTAAADALRAGGYPLRPFLTFRMPGLAVTLAAIPQGFEPWLLAALAVLVAGTWWLRLAEALPRPLPRVALAVLLAGSFLAFFQGGLVAFHEIWAGLFVALSLAVRRPGRWLDAAALALVAMLIRETAALYVLVMAVCAWRDGERREAAGWIVALLLFAAALGAHAWAVMGVTGPLDPASPGWAGFNGLGLFFKSMTLATALQMLPLWLGTLLVALALFGWTSWRDPLAGRTLAILAAYALAIAVFARLDTFYWGLMVAPLLLAGLAFVPDGLRDLFRQSRERKRAITVTRLAR